MLRYVPAASRQRDEHRREPREAQERRPAELGRARPDHGHELDEPSDPQHRRREVHPVRELGQPRVAGIRRRVSRERQARREHESERERHPQERAHVKEPREIEERRHEDEAERHHDERLAEACPVRKRCEVAVDEAPERQLQHVLAAEQEGRDADVEHADGADARDEEEAILRARRERAAHDEQLEAESADDEREREEVQPADDVLCPRRSSGADRVRHRRRAHADAEGVDAGDDVAVVRERLPANGVRAFRQLRQRDDDLALRRDRARRPGHVLAVEPEHLDRLRQRVDGLIELQHDLPRRPGQLLPEHGRLLPQRRVRERSRGKREGGKCGEKKRASHRCGGPANCDRWPRIGATSRSQ